MLIDTHTHLEGFARKGELDAVVTRARQAGVSRMITIGTGPEDWHLYRELAAQHAGTVDYTVGLHPCSVDAFWERAVAELEAWAPTPAAPPPDRCSWCDCRGN
ncbi:MAG: hypothetical protein HC834_02300 [Rhodospirillales bacterium]|nr:hypothetical protein [Rhodospirillales bacterium]